MSRADYAHWNEEQDIVWWNEEGKHALDEPGETWEDERQHDAADAFAEDVAEMDIEGVIRLLSDADYRRRWPQAVPILQHELEYRGWVA